MLRLAGPIAGVMGLSSQSAERHLPLGPVNVVVVADSIPHLPALDAPCMSKPAACECASSEPCGRAESEARARSALLALTVRTPLSSAAACLCAPSAADDEFAGVCASEVDDSRTPLTKAEAWVCASGDRDAVVVAPAGALTAAVVARIIEIMSSRDFINRSFL